MQRFASPASAGDMSFLASDELQGRGSGTRDEHLAALYAASLFAGFGLEPGGANGSFLQRVPLPSPLPPKVAASLVGFAPGPRTETWNVVGILRGSDPVAGKQAILLTAHLDHLGIGPRKNGDRIYNGADDDASGTTAVIELARVFAAAPHPARTVLFVLFGSEEIGGYGNRYFLDHPPVPLGQIVANLEFEMIGRRDPALPPGWSMAHRFPSQQPGPRAGAPRRRPGCPILTPRRTSFSDPTTTVSPAGESLPTLSPASACMPTTMSRATKSAASTFLI